MLECFTEHGRRAIALAQDEARQLHDQAVGVQHLLLAILEVDGGQMAHSVLRVSAAQVRQILESSSRETADEAAAPIPFAPNAKRVMEVAVRESLNFDEYADVSHLLVGILRAGDEVTDQVLAALRVDRDQAYRQAHDLIVAKQRGQPGHLPPYKPQVLPPTTEELIRQMVRHHDALVAALRRYGRHDNNCSTPNAPCTCGLSSAFLGADDDPTPSD